MQTFILNDYHLKAAGKEDIRSGQNIYYNGYFFVIDRVLERIDRILVKQLDVNETYFVFELNKLFIFLLDYDVYLNEEKEQYYYLRIKYEI